MPIRIMIADDHRLFRAGLKTLMNADSNLEVVGEATHGEEAIQVAQAVHPEIAIMDISMPGAEGPEITRRLIQAEPTCRVLMLTMHDDSALVQEYLRAGASGYIIKRAAESELIDAIYAVWRGIIYIHPSLMSLFIHPLAKVKPPDAFAAEYLTTRELEVLRLIVLGHTNRQIAGTLSISVRTVETHRSNLMDKLNLHSRVDLVRYASDHKLI